MFKFYQTSLIPNENLFPNIKNKLISLINSSTKVIYLQSFLLNLSASEEGLEILSALENALKRKVSISLILDHSSRVLDQKDLAVLTKYPNFKLDYIQVTDYFEGGVCHIKLYIFDETQVMLGSPNLLSDSYDGRTVDEICFVSDNKDLVLNCINIFKFWSRFIVTQNSKRSVEYRDPVNHLKLHKPVLTDESKVAIQKYLKPVSKQDITKDVLSFSPLLLDGSQFVNDRDVIIECIRKANKTIDISSYTFNWLMCYREGVDNMFFSELSNAVLNNGVKVRILIGQRIDHLNPLYIKEFQEFVGYINTIGYHKMKKQENLIQMQLINLLPDHRAADNRSKRTTSFQYVLHSKYIVTDNSCFFSTSNFSPDYYYTTIGVAYLFHDLDIVSQIQKHFNNRWCDEKTFHI